MAKPRKKVVPADARIEQSGRVFGYGRVSTGRQQVSTEYQEARLQGYFDARFKPFGLEYVGYFADADVSGRVPFRDRDAGGRVFEAIRSGDHLIVTRPDRAFRNLADAFGTLETWERQGIYVHLIEYGLDTSTAMGKLAIAFLSLFADFERRMVSERTKDVQRQRKAMGLAYSGAPPFCFKVSSRKIGHRDGRDVYEKKLIIDMDECRIARKIYLLRENKEQWMRIREKFRQHNIIHRGGHNEWQPSSLYQLLQAYKRLIAEGKLPPGLGPYESSESTPSSVSIPSTPTPSHAPREG